MVGCKTLKAPNSYGTMPLMKSLASRLRLIVYWADIPVPGTRTSTALVDLIEEDNGDVEPSSPPHSGPPSSTGIDHKSIGSSPRTRTANLIGCCGKGISSKPTKRAKVDRNLMEALDKLADSMAEIEKLRIETTLTMHKENLFDCQENRILELEMFQLQQASGERMASIFADVLKKSTE